MSRNKSLESVSKALIVMAMAVLALAPGAWAQGQFKALYRFTDGNGGYPSASLIFDSAGNLYGTTTAGGTYGDGVVFELARLRFWQSSDVRAAAGKLTSGQCEPHAAGGQQAGGASLPVGQPDADRHATALPPGKAEPPPMKPCAPRS